MLLDIHTDGHAVPYIEQYYGCWEIQERAAQAMANAARNMRLNVHLADQRSRPREALQTESYELAGDGVAVIPIHGALMKQETSAGEGTSTVAARRQIRAAVNSDAVTSIILHIDSPGGTVAGTGDLADAVHEAAKSKEVIAYVEDLAASAGYKIASQATRIVANRKEALVGSLGTFLVVNDVSAAAEDAGIKVHVIKAGEFKGAGAPGTPITEEQIEQWQTEVDLMASAFKSVVKRGRGDKIKDLDSLFDGRVYSAQAAVSLGLIDAVETIDEVIATLSQTIFQEREIAMSEAKEAERAATVAEIQKHCRGIESDPEFLIEVADSGFTLEDVWCLWADRLSEKVTALELELGAVLDERDAAREELASMQEETLAEGVAALETEEENATEDPADVFEEWNKALLEKIESGIPRARAVAQLCRERPELQRKFVAAAN